jgi:hypothetical protein
MDPGGTPNSFAPSGGWFRSVHHFLASVEPGILNALTGSILFHSGAVLTMAVLVAGPVSTYRNDGSLVLAVPSSLEPAGELTLDVSDDELMADPEASFLDTEAVVAVAELPDVPVEFDPSGIKANSETSAVNTAIAAASLTSEEIENDGGAPGESESGESGGRGAQADDAAEADEAVQVAGHGAQFFGVEGRGDRFVYVVDCSRSMIGEKWNRVREELVRSLDELKQDQSFYIILFDGQSHPMFGPSEVAKEMLPASGDNIARARRWVMGYQLGANTSPLASVTHAMKLKPHAVFLLTDGEFADPTAQWLRDHNREVRISEKPRIRVPVHTIGIFNKKTQKLLKRIARENNGQFQFISERYQ